MAKRITRRLDAVFGDSKCTSTFYCAADLFWTTFTVA